MEAMTISEHASECAKELLIHKNRVAVIQKHMDAAIAEAIRPAIAELTRLLDVTGEADAASIQSEIDRLKTLIGEK